MREGYVTMMHTGFPEVNHDLYLWRDEHNVLHVSRKGNRYRTLCGENASNMTYAGRLEAPTCLLCVTTP